MRKKGSHEVKLTSEQASTKREWAGREGRCLLEGGETDTGVVNVEGDVEGSHEDVTREKMRHGLDTERNKEGSIEKETKLTRG